MLLSALPFSFLFPLGTFSEVALTNQFFILFLHERIAEYHFNTSLLTLIFSMNIELPQCALLIVQSWMWRSNK